MPGGREGRRRGEAVNGSFEETQQRFFLLKGQLAAGRITREQFEAARQELTITDAQGHYWALGADDGQWYIHDGQNWVRGVPPGTGGNTAPAERPLAGAARRGHGVRRGPGATVPSPTNGRRAPRGCRRRLGWLLLAALLVGLGIGGYALVLPLLPGLHGGDCRRVAGAANRETVRGSQLTCGFGVADALTIEQGASREVALTRIAAYSLAQQQLLASLSGSEGFGDRSSWQAESALYDVRGTVGGQPLFTREGLWLYRDRYLLQLRLANWNDEAALQARWLTLSQNAKKLVDARFR
jgi:hypothetical protein